MIEKTEALPLAVSVQQASYLLGISERHARRLVAEDVIPSIRLRGRVLVPLAGLIRLLRGEEVDGDE